MGWPAGSVRAALFEGYDDAHATEAAIPRLERGELTMEEFHAELQARLGDGADGGGRAMGHAPPEVDLGTLLGGGAFGVHWMVVARVRALRDQGYKVGLLTNNVREWSDAWRATIPVDVFHDVVDSSEVGLRKPDARIFELAASRLGASPPECVFLDDMDSNVAGARAVGMEAILVTDPWDALAALDAVLAAHRDG